MNSCGERRKHPSMQAFSSPVPPTTREDTVAGLRARLEQTERQAAARQRQLERYAADLREIFKQERIRAQELRSSYVATVRALSNAVEARDAYTGKHAERVAAYGLELARTLGLDIEARPEIEFGFLLHDVGKVAVPDAILFKSGPLTPEEYALVRRHPVIGGEILRDVEFLGEGKQVVCHHHERWDGSGYPSGLAGDAIPLPARVFALADTLDALTTDRPYRPASPFPRAREIIRAAGGTQFDPSVVEAYESIGDETLRPPGKPRAMTRTILIVDDDPTIRKLIATTLEDVSGYRLQEAADGQEAVDPGAERAARDRLPGHRHAAAERHRGLPPAAVGPGHRRRDDRHAHRPGRRRGRAQRRRRRRRPLPHQAVLAAAPAAARGPARRQLGTERLAPRAQRGEPATGAGGGR